MDASSGSSQLRRARGNLGRLVRGESMSPIAAASACSIDYYREVAPTEELTAMALEGPLPGRNVVEATQGRQAGAPSLVRQVSTWLEQLWSPQEIAERLRLEHPDDPMMQVSHETIYQSLFVQGRGELRRELARCLRSGRTPSSPGPGGEEGQDPEHGHDQRAPGRGRDRAVPDTGKVTSSLGRQQVSRWDPRRAQPPASCSSCTFRTL